MTPGAFLSATKQPRSPQPAEFRLAPAKLRKNADPVRQQNPGSTQFLELNSRRVRKFVNVSKLPELTNLTDLARQSSAS